jgi:hypothetical protein
MRSTLIVLFLLLLFGVSSGCKSFDHEMNYAGNTGAIPEAADFSSGTLWAPKSK